MLFWRLSLWRNSSWSVTFLSPLSSASPVDGLHVSPPPVLPLSKHFSNSCKLFLQKKNILATFIYLCMYLFYLSSLIRFYIGLPAPIQPFTILFSLPSPLIATSFKKLSPTIVISGRTRRGGTEKFSVQLNSQNIIKRQNLVEGGQFLGQAMNFYIRSSNPRSLTPLVKICWQQWLSSGYSS